MDESVNEVVDLLNVKSKDVRLLSIWGMGGIGKTTLAKVVYDNLSTNFDRCSFISDIREASQGSGLLNVQRRLVFDIIGDVEFKLSSIDHAKNVIKNRFCKKKVLIFLDDVDHENQLMALAANKDWFGSGSRIVVTTRDRSILCRFEDQFERCLIYEVKELNNLTALQLFSKHAFRSNSPPNTFLSLSETIIAKTGGLPLAMEVIGSFLCGKKNKAVWQDTLKKMEYSQHKDVKDKLMLSYEALDYHQQQIFLDIACFLAGQDKSYPYYMWDDCGFFPNEGIDVLVLRSLVKIEGNNLLWMHDQLKDLGRSIVYDENCKDPRKGYRMWLNSKGPHIAQQKKGTDTAAFYMGINRLSEALF
ncbi:disease resistance protein RPV1-like [Eucalyptus grandis]|uniref:disease resistance protein RPV1-like n=1 Tax=Eucalyptus grandis TaxID=71139 RepID=UPI00192E8FED|nr:disease resistance protein RPV1-like [Eucalyptus grandis]